MDNYDFHGWATKANLKCADGRTIMSDAFRENDGKVVPLLWNHQHDDPLAVLGHALLENRKEGVYAHCSFNDTESGRAAKDLVAHGDVDSLSIWANQLIQDASKNVKHGNIREVSLVLASANPGAAIESVIRHGEECDDESIIFTGDSLELCHADTEITEVPNNDEEEKQMPTNEPAPKEKTVQDVFDELTEEQKTVVYAIVGQAVEDATNNKDDNDEEEDPSMKHNIFNTKDAQDETVLSHDAMTAIIDDGKRIGSLKESFLSHAATYGIENIDYLFPDAKAINNTPDFISREMGWVTKVMNSVHHTPFSRIKSVFANITEDDARAKGYIKGSLKKEEVFTLLKRSTDPTTVFKKQKLDRDDVLDITDFDVVAWLKTEMRTMLDEELARAILIGDGRLSSSDDHINDTHIRPISTDAELYTIRAKVPVAAGATDADKAKAFIRAVIKSRKDYKGSGEPTLYTTEDMVTECLLLEDGIGHMIYDSVAKLAAVLRVKEIVTVPVMDNAKGAAGGDLLGLIVNLTDYNVGADKGGSVNMFDDFDINYNQQLYLIETRCSGALTKPYSAIEIETEVAAG